MFAINGLRSIDVFHIASSTKYIIYNKPNVERRNLNGGGAYVSFCIKCILQTDMLLTLF